MHAVSCKDVWVCWFWSAELFVALRDLWGAHLPRHLHVHHVCGTARDECAAREGTTPRVNMLFAGYSGKVNLLSFLFFV